PAANLANNFACFAVELSPDKPPRHGRIQEEVMITAAAEDSTTTQPEIRREAGAVDRETQSKCAENGPNRMTIFGPTKANDAIVKNIVSLRIEDKALHAEPEIAMNEILRVNTTTEGVIHGEVSFIAPLSASEGVGAREAEVK